MKHEEIFQIQPDNDLTKEQVAGEAYQVIGSLAGTTGFFDHPEVERALNYFGDIANGEPPTRCKEILPWGIQPEDEPFDFYLAEEILFDSEAYQVADGSVEDADASPKHSVSLKESAQSAAENTT